jgi:adenylate cyclase
MSVMPTLVVLTGLVVGVVTLLAARATVTSMADDLFRIAAQQAATEARANLLRAVPTLDLADAFYADDRNVMARRFDAILRANPEFSWVSYSGADGSFTGAFHSADGAYRINQSEIVNGSTEMVEHDVDAQGAWKVRRRESETGYDPRTRPFYKLAAEAKRRVWTPPYVFFDQGVPGITCASPRLGPGGEVLGVFTVDFDLNRLSKAVAAIRLAEHGRIAVLTTDGLVLAHPTLRLVESTGQGGDGRVLSTKDLPDPAVKALFHQAAERADPGAGFTQRRFELDDATWLGGWSVVPIDRDLQWLVAVVAPESDFLVGVERNKWIAIAVAAGTMLLSILLALLLAARISHPLGRIAGEMAQVGRMQLEDTSPPSTHFVEIARIDDSLATMRGGLRSFARYVPTDLVRRLLASGQEAVLSGDVRPLSVLFVDIRGFTGIAEATPPAELVSMLGRWFEEATRIVAACRGTVDKFIGDAVMAFWGAPEAEPEHAAWACEAAIELQRRLHALRAARTGWAERFHVRVGIATGDVLVGNIGAPERLNYTVIGDAVNLASRLEGLNKAFGTGSLVAESTYRAAQHRVLGRAVGVVAVSGRQQATRVYELVGRLEDCSATEREVAGLCERALDALLARDFRGAIELYRAALERGPGDDVLERRLAQARALERNPPAEGWTGVEVFTEK